MALKTSTTSPETAIKANEREAARMFERGVAAARGGQKRVAAVLLARAVQLDPQHELGWLWLSGVLEEPDEIAFCLRSVLALNPHNERARQGLAWLEQRRLIAAAPTPEQAHVNGRAPTRPAALEREEAAPGEDAPELPGWRRRLLALPALLRGIAAPREDESHAVYHGESWWVNWRRSHRAMGRARLVLWLVPLLLLLLTLALNSFLRGAVERNVALAQAAAARTAATPAPSPTPAPAAVLQAELAPAGDARVLAYLSAIEAPRAHLRDAVQSYRNATSQPGGSSTTHASAARRLREQVEAAYRTFEALSPPPPLALAHAEYLAGLERERAALDEMLAFYGSFRVEHANRAALHMGDAAAHFARARESFERQRAALAGQHMHAQTAR
ncbi:MAG TPA: hypothetical protein VNL77_15470 [Roseiflexaceae bacterium]|nr:hypothetical protein [Roseiflexaceae bacterium]